MSEATIMATPAPRGDAAPERHGRLSPSAAHRWLQCPGSVRLAEEAGDEGSPAAAEGTRAHALLAAHLRGGEDIYLPDDDVSGEMGVAVAYAAGYVRHRQTLAGLPKLDAERWLPLSHLGVKGLEGGTADVILWSREYQREGGMDVPSSIEIIDFKYGAMPVEAEGNVQLMCYALGALHMLGASTEGRWPTVRLTIVQPRDWRGPAIRSHDMTPRDLAGWASLHLIPRAREAGGDDTARLSPTEDACRFCPAKLACPAHHELAAQAFEHANTVGAEGQDDIATAAAYERLPVLRQYIKAVEDRVEASMLGGEGVFGSVAKIVRRAKRRRYLPGAVKLLREMDPDRLDELAPRTPIGLTDMKRRIGEKALARLVDSPPDEYTVAPLSDRRKAVAAADIHKAAFDC